MIALRQPFWWPKDSDRPWLWPLLLGLSCLYRLGFFLRQKLTKPVPLPRAICVGNATAGGSGKTPTLIAIAELLGPENVVFLTRGYGGALKGPLLADKNHSAREIGDEAVLLGQTAPVVIAKNRIEGARLARDVYPDRILLLDDGLQNPTFKTAIDILVWDEFGAGNGHLLPAGPLRAPLAFSLGKSDAVIAINTDNAPTATAFTARGVVPQAADHRPVMAFAGIGRPQKFHDSLLASGYKVLQFYPFPDHHAYSEGEVEALVAHNMPLLTTEKDWVRLPLATRAIIRAVPYRIAFDDETAVKNFLIERLAS